MSVKVPSLSTITEWWVWMDRMEDLSFKWDHIKLLEEEQVEIDIKDDLFANIGSREYCSLIGKLLIDCRMSKEVLRSMMIKLWKVDSKLQFTMIWLNTFITSFTCFEDNYRFFSKRLWFFENQSFYIETI